MNTKIKVAIALAIVGFIAFNVSGIPRLKTATRGDGMNYVVSEIVWLTFLVCALALIVLGVATGARAVARRMRG